MLTQPVIWLALLPLIAGGQVPDSGRPAPVVTPAKATAPARRGGHIGSPRSFVPAGYRVLMQRKADLNLDGRTDCLLILAPRNEEQFYAARTDVNQLPSPRLLLLAGRADKQYQLRVRNANATDRYGEDCNFRDSLDGLEVGRGWLRLRHYNGQITRTLRETTFTYQPATASWRLSEDDQTMFHSMHPEEAQTRSLLKRRVSLARFNIHDY